MMRRSKNVTTVITTVQSETSEHDTSQRPTLLSSSLVSSENVSSQQSVQTPPQTFVGNHRNMRLSHPRTDTCTIPSRNKRRATAQEATQAFSDRQCKTNGGNIKRNLKLCVFHGLTPFNLVKHKSKHFLSCFKNNASLSSQCEKCCEALETFIDAAAKHDCVIHAIDYPTGSSKSAVPHMCYQKKQNPSLNASETQASDPSGGAAIDEFRVEVVCHQAHKFLFTQAHLKANTWCPICVVQKKLAYCPKPPPKERYAFDYAHPQELQKLLLENAQRIFLSRYKNNHHIPTLENKSLPPSFVKPKAAPFTPLYGCSSFETSTVYLSSKSCNSKENTIHSLALQHAALYEGVSYTHALPIVRILNSSFDPSSVLQIKSPWNLKEARAAYVSLARQIHPDKNPHPQAKSVFHVLQFAWQSILSTFPHTEAASTKSP